MRIPGKRRGRNTAGLEQGREKHRALASGINKGLFLVIRKRIDGQSQLLIDHRPQTRAVLQHLPGLPDPAPSPWTSVLPHSPHSPSVAPWPLIPAWSPSWEAEPSIPILKEGLQWVSMFAGPGWALVRSFPHGSEFQQPFCHLQGPWGDHGSIGGWAGARAGRAGPSSAAETHPALHK